MKQHKAIIIGAGYGGMALANLLGKAGWRVNVFEKNEAPGGRLSAFVQDGFTFDIGPSWYLMPEVFEQYYTLFGESSTDRLKLLRLTPGYKVFLNRQAPVTIQGDHSDEALFESIEPGAGKRLQKYISRSSAIYQNATTHFLYNNYDSLLQLLTLKTLRYAPQLGLLAIQKLDALVARSFHDQRLRQILEYHTVFLGSSPFDAPAVYTLMSNLDFNSGIYYPHDGMMSLVDDMKDLGKAYRITYNYHTEVTRILHDGRNVNGIELSNGTRVYADIVISNADLHHTETKLLEPAYQSYPERYWRRRQPGPGAFVLSLGIRGALPQLLHHNLYFVDDWKGNFEAIYTNKRAPDNASMYVCNPNKTDPLLAPAGHENLFMLVPFPSGVTLSESQTVAYANACIRTLSSAIGQPDLGERIVTKRVFGPDDFMKRYHAWQYNAFGGESHVLSQSVALRTRNYSRKLRNLYYVGAGTQPGIGLPMCIISAELAYKRIMNIMRQGPLMADDIG